MSSLSNETSAHEEFVALLSRHSRRIYGFIMALVVYQQDADEVFQNTSLALWRKHGDFASGTSFWAWACQIAYYEVLRFREKSNRAKAFSGELLPLLASSLLAREEQVTMLEQSLHDCLDRLKEPDRLMVELRYFHERSPKQIARSQSRSVHSIYRALSRIHDQLLQCLHQANGVEGVP
ncbi:MAG: sigma-70 family RNA polymerase sigma factor [Pirellulales bacterium]|nr:sigma-70 family RNA polymerase sigma factor [Pirellulales bacterium]